MSKVSQFGLLRKRRFGPFFITQFLGAFNDNLFKNALLIVVAYSAMRTPAEIGLINNIAAGLFILPFFLFALVAGNLADTKDKSKIIRTMKISEVMLALWAVPALLSQNILAMLIVLFGFGLQSAFFAPAKYSIMPQHLKTEELMGGNALVQTGTFIAILIGTLLGGILAASADTLPYLAAIIVLVAVAGLYSGYQVPEAKPVEKVDEVFWHPVAMFKEAFAAVRPIPGVFVGILGVSWFWFLGAVILTQLPAFAKHILGVAPEVVSVLLALFSVGIGAGAVLCGRVSRGEIELGLVPLGAIGMTIFGCLFAYSDIFPHEGLLSVGAFYGSFDGLWIAAKVVLIGLFGGLYIVPLMANIQDKSDEKLRGRVMAINSLMNALFMVLAALFSIVLLVILEWDLRTLLALTALGNIVMLVVYARKYPEYFLRLVMWMLANCNYRVKHNGVDLIPEKGPVLLVANHVTYIDWLFLGAVSKRTIHFVMHKPFYDIPVIKSLFKMAGAIPIMTRKECQQSYDEAMEMMKQTLKDGKVMVIFPEGRLTDTGEMNVFQRGYQKVLEEAPATVIPVALTGLWGSFFSRKGGKAFSKPFRRIYSKVGVEVGEPFEDAIPEPKVMRLKIQEMLDKPWYEK